MARRVWWSSWSLAWLMAVLCAAGAGADPDDSILGIVDPADEGLVVLAESDPPGIVEFAPVDPQTGAFALRGLPPGHYRFTVPGVQVLGYVYDGAPFVSLPFGEPFTPPLLVPEPGLPRTLDLPIFPTGPFGTPLNAGIFNEDPGPEPNTVQVVVYREIGRAERPEDAVSHRGLEPVPGVAILLRTSEGDRTATTDANGRVGFEVGLLTQAQTVQVVAEGALETDWSFGLEGGAFRGDRVALDLPTGLFPPAAVGFLFPGRLGGLDGRAFRDAPPANGTWDPDEEALADHEVVLVRAGVADAAPRTTTTDAAGRYAFGEVEDGIWTVGLDGMDYRRLVTVAGAEQKTSGDLAVPPAPAPVVRCCEGELHAALVSTRVWVGEGDWAHCVEARLLDGCHRRRSPEIDYAGLYFDPRVGSAEPAQGLNEVLTIQSVRKEGGFLNVQLLLEAAPRRFPAGFFGDVRRLVEVTVDGCHTSRGCAAFRCAEIRPGYWFSWNEETCGSRPACPVEEVSETPPAGCHARFRVLAATSWEAWRTTDGSPCVAQSVEGDGPFERVDVEIDVWAPVRRRNFEASLLHVGRTMRDRVRVRFPDGSWEGEAEGRRGILRVMHVWQVEKGHWRAHVRVTAPARPDGNPGALPGWEVGIRTRTNGRSREAWLDLGGPLELGPVEGEPGETLYRVTGFRTARDAGACR